MNNPLPLKTKPYTHQIEAYNFAITKPNVALLMEQGTGKSLAAIAVMGHHYFNKRIKRVLIVAPLSVIGSWEEQFPEHADFSYKVFPLVDKIKRRQETVHKWVDTDALQVLLINYDALPQMEQVLAKWRPDMVVADESQYIKNHKAKRAKALTKLGKVAKYRMILTGTPVTKSPIDFFSQYQFLDESIFGRRFRDFRDRYAIMGGYMGYQITGFRDLEDLAARAHRIAYRVTKAEALDLPDTVDQILRVPLSPKTRKLYDEMKKEAILELKRGTVTAPIVLTKILRLQQIAGGFVSLEHPEDPQLRVIQKVGTEKLDVCEEVVDDTIVAGKKVVVFARFLPEINALAKRLKASGTRYHLLVGGTKSHVRKAMIRSFQDDPEVKVFIAQISTGGVGITLTAADTVIFLSLGYSLGDYEQAKARVHRIGQNQKVTYIHIVAKGTVDTEIMAKLRAKKDLAKTVVDDLKNILKGSAQDEVEEE